MSHERPGWSDKNGGNVIESELLKNGQQWISDWTLRIDRNGEDGWQYSIDFNALFSKK